MTLALCVGPLMFLLRSSGLFARCVISGLYWFASSFDCSRNQFITRSNTVKKNEYMKVGVAFSNHLDTSAFLEARQVGHHKCLLWSTHIAIVNIKSQARGVRRSFDQNCITVHPPQGAVILLMSDERANGQRPIELMMIRCRYIFDNL